MTGKGPVVVLPKPARRLGATLQYTQSLRQAVLGEDSRLEKIGHDAFGATGLDPSSLGPVSRAAL